MAKSRFWSTSVRPEFLTVLLLTVMFEAGFLLGYVVSC